LHPRSSYLTIEDGGFKYCSLFRHHMIQWSDVSRFGVLAVPGKTMVGFNYSASYGRAPKARAISVALSGFEAALPDTYGLTAEELARLLADCQREWTRKARSAS
jgi:hypothetical protein